MAKPRRWTTRRPTTTIIMATCRHTIISIDECVSSLLRHARAWRGHPRLAYGRKDVDGRDKPGHDDGEVGETQCAYKSPGGTNVSCFSVGTFGGHSATFWNSMCMNRNKGFAFITSRMHSSFSSSEKCWCTQAFSTIMASPASQS